MTPREKAMRRVAELVRLRRQREELDQQILRLERQDPPEWAAYLIESLGGLGSVSQYGSVTFSREEREQLGDGAPLGVYCPVDAFRLSVSNLDAGPVTGPGLLRVLQAVCDLLQARIDGEIND